MNYSLAGMQAALTLNDRGHEVDIYEKDKTGGQFNLAWLPSNKESLKEIIDYFEYELKQRSIPVFHQEATAKELLSNNYDGILLATGAVPTVPPIKGLKEYFWTEFLEEENLPENQKVEVIGGELIGIEISSELVDKENNVIIVEMGDAKKVGKAQDAIRDAFITAKEL